MFQSPSSALPLCLLVAIFAICGVSRASTPDPADCSGQGGATLLMKGSCAIGGELKVKMAGIPQARYKLWMDRGAGPVEIPGVGTLCLDFGPEKVVVAKGRFNNLGYKSFYVDFPDDPDLLGQTLAFQFASEDEDAPNGIAISNAYIFEGCESAESEDCDQGIRRLGYFTVVPYEGSYPVDLTVRAEGAGGGGGDVGEVTFEFDPENPPALPQSSGDGGTGLTVTGVDAYPTFLIVHAVVKGCDHANGRLPNETLFETEVDGEVVAARQIHTSCSVPIGAGARFAPVFITFFQDVKNAPPGDCP